MSNLVKDLRKKSEKDLIKQADTLRVKIAKFKRTKLTENPGKDVHQFRKMKRELATTLTILKETKSQDNKVESKEKK